MDRLITRSHTHIRITGTGNGSLAAHGKVRLMLLGSPPDMVHGFPLRKTASVFSYPGVGIHPC